MHQLLVLPLLPGIKIEILKAAASFTLQPEERMPKNARKSPPQ